MFHEDNHFGHVLELEMATVNFTRESESSIWFRLCYEVSVAAIAFIIYDEDSSLA